MDSLDDIDRGSNVIDRIAAVLAPYLGSHMAQASIELYKKKLGIGEVPTQEQSEELITKLVLGLSVFVGEEKTAMLAAEMRAVAKGD